MKELMSELGLSIVYLATAGGFITLMLWLIGRLNAGGA
jgi:hypothetical protein